MIRNVAALAAAIGLAFALCACETATPYQPLKTGTTDAGGFTDQKIEADRFTVVFQGNSATSRQTVETYLLYRAAEITVSQGYDWFEAVHRLTDVDSQVYVSGGPYWGASWRYWGGYGWGGWGGYASVQTVRQFQATTEILLHHGPKPVGNPRAYDARAVMTNLRLKITLPPPARS